MTDREIMIHRFKNPHKSTSILAKEVGITKRVYEEACVRAMKEDNWLGVVKAPVAVKVKIRRHKSAGK